MSNKPRRQFTEEMGLKPCPTSSRKQACFPQGGSQYASSDYRSALQAAGIGCSMSRKGNCWDNAVAESFFGTIKTELINSRVFDTTEEAKSTIVEWIEVFYNRQRLHSTLNYPSPVQFEEQYWSSLKQPTAA